MNICDYRHFLVNHFGSGSRAVADAISRTKRIGRVYNLREEYNRDGLDRVIATLSYSAEDMHNGRPVPDGFVFKINPSDVNFAVKIRASLQSLANAARLAKAYFAEGGC